MCNCVYKIVFFARSSVFVYTRSRASVFVYMCSAREYVYLHVSSARLFVYVACVYVHMRHGMSVGLYVGTCVAILTVCEHVRISRECLCIYVYSVREYRMVTRVTVWMCVIVYVFNTRGITIFVCIRESASICNEGRVRMTA